MKPDWMSQLLERVRTLSHPLAPLPTGVEPKLKALPGIRAVLFDIYGTLLVSGSGDVGTAAATDSAEAMDQALVNAGFKLSSESAAGTRGVEILEQAVRSSHEVSRQNGVEWPEVEILQIWEELIETLVAETRVTGYEGMSMLKRLAVEYECRVNPVWPMPGLRETLSGLRERDCQLGIVSNAQFYTPIMLAGLLGTELPAMGFEDPLCVWSYRERQGKPSPHLFEKATDALQRHHRIRPEQTLYVGNDMRNDIAAACRSGCRTALFAGDRRSLRRREEDPFCAGVVPDLVLTELPQLLTALTERS
jgi:putative hydrolase of the HAD superfamily